ncbi:MAG TPA: virulence factor [Steroidobacteraceae bacterium]|nr:virulence factor [Steroidobacteraceae bacterium]
MASLIVISWRDIPAQVIVKRGREAAKVQLSHRFQEAVDRAAMRAGKGSSDAYLADWQRSAPRPCGEDLKAEAAAEAARLEAKFTDQDLERLIRAKGVEVAQSASSTTADPGTAADLARPVAAPDEPA